MAFRGRLFVWLSSVVVALLVGVTSAYVAVEWGGSRAVYHVGPWTVDTSMGSPRADLYSRARTSLHALMALEKKETLYYIATHDSSGALLRGDCTYLVAGEDPAARWWSITAYGADHYLVPNDANVFSFSKTTVGRRETGDFLIRVSAQQKPGNWLPVRAGDAFDLTLRLYNPERRVYEQPWAAALPAVTMEGCR
jgi:hypothetical protein